MNFFPLCTASVWPIISGDMVERLDQVLCTFFSFPSFILVTAFSRCLSINGPFLTERAMIYSVLVDALAPLLSAPDNKLVGSLVVTGRIAACGLSPRCDRVAAAACLSFTTAVWVIYRVHSHAAHRRTLAHPARSSGLADRDVLVLYVADLTDSSHALYLHAAY